MLQKMKGQVTSFGGIHLVHEQVMAKKIPQLITEALGKRSANAVYRYSDLLLSRCYTAFCGGDCAEDINYVRKTFSHLKGLKVPSPDTILNMETALSTPARELISSGGSRNKININERLNGLLVKTALHLDVLNAECKDYCLDFDHQFIACEKYDTTYSYKKERGYFPGVASIENVPVYIEGRNGNSSVKFKQLDTFKRIFGLLGDNNIKPARCRMDSGSYIKEVCDYLHGRSVKFYIRAERSDELLFNASMSNEWKGITMGFNKYQTCSIEHRFGEHVHRIVCYRWANKTRQISAITGDANNYLFLITNDKEWDEKTIIEFYNQRGNSERLFDIQNNDFNWNKLPHSFLEQNTVYLIVMAICHVMYKWIIRVISKTCDFLQPHYRLKKFTFRLICIAASVIHSGPRQIVKLFTDKPLDLKALSP